MGTGTINFYQFPIVYQEKIICQLKFYFLGDFLDIQCPHMTKAFFLFFKENVLHFIFMAFNWLHFITTLHGPHTSDIKQTRK